MRHRKKKRFSLDILYEEGFRSCIILSTKMSQSLRSDFLHTLWVRIAASCVEHVYGILERARVTSMSPLLRDIWVQLLACHSAMSSLTREPRYSRTPCVVHREFVLSTLSFNIITLCNNVDE